MYKDAILNIHSLGDIEVTICILLELFNEHLISKTCANE